MSFPWSKATGAAIGVDWLLNAVAPKSALGRRAAERLQPFVRGDEVRAQAAVARIAQIAQTIDRARLSGIASAVAIAPTIVTAIDRARLGATLTDDEFFEFGRFLDAVAHAQSLAQQTLLAIDDVAAGLSDLSAALAPGRKPGRSWYLDDAFSPELHEARDLVTQAQAALDGAHLRTRRAAADALGLADLHDGEFTLERNRAETLPANVRVLREGATYRLCRLEADDAETAMRDARDLAANAVARIEDAVRARLTATVARSARELDAANVALGEMDVLIARAAFAQLYACTMPQIGADTSADLEDVRYLPLADELVAAGRSFTPISMSLDGVAVITGPNMGGKTVALRALGFAVACVSLGVPVPASRARLPLVDRIAWLGVDLPPDAGGLLSSFGREVVALREFLEAPVARDVVLVDEFARTTSPDEGRALTVALVRALVDRGALGLVATHFADVAGAADTTHLRSGRLGVPAPGTGDDLAAALARLAAAMEYTLVRTTVSDPPSTDALALAAMLGLDQRLVTEARRLLSSS